MSENTGSSKGLAVAALICGILAFFCNPCYLIGIVAIILGGIAMSKHDPASKGMAMAGLILGIAATILQPLVDFIVTIFSGGMGFFTAFL